jgi:uncharacterized protein (DUF736 family)
MAYEPQNDTGAIFPNRKQHERQPDWRGNAMVNGKMVDIAAWVKRSQKGTEFLSLKFSEPRDQVAAPPAQSRQATHRPIPDTEIPF